MKNLTLTLLFLNLLGSISLNSQTIKYDENRLEPVNVSISFENLMGKKVIKVIKDPTIKEFDQPTFAKMKNVEFSNGTIEVTVFSRLLKDAPDFSRGFIGIAFRIDSSDSNFECIYLRPTNGRAENQLRRNRSIQYFSYPDFSFERLRKEAPGEYESYSDMGLSEWINLKIEVKDRQAKLFLNNSKQPALIVNDLKLGDKIIGDIGLWVDVGTEGFFSNLKISKD